MAKTQTVIKTTMTDGNDDGITDYTSQITSTYKGGNLVYEEYTSDSTGAEGGGPDGVPEMRQIYTAEYDNKGRQTYQTIAQDMDNDGNLDGNTFASWTYDRKGNVVQERAGSDYDSDGTWDTTWAWDRTFNKDGNLTEEKISYDWEGDGAIDRVDTTTNTYDSNGKILASHEDNYTDGVDNIVRTYEYHDGGRTVFLTNISDSNGDGRMDYTNWTTTTLDRKGNVVREEYRTDSINSDGIVDSIVNMEAKYDKQGRMVEQTWLRDDDGNGAWDSFDASTWKFDKRGNVVQQRGEADWNFDGAFDTIYEINRTFDRSGNLLTETGSYDDDGAGGAPPRVDTTKYVYNDAGEISGIYTDYGSDGLIDITTVYDYPTLA
jgi:hypothetical protein